MMPTCGELAAMEGRPDLATAKGSGIIRMALGFANRGANYGVNRKAGRVSDDSSHLPHDRR